MDEYDATSAMIFGKRSDKIDMTKQRPSLANSAKVDAAEQGSDGLTTGNMLAIPAGVTKG